MTEPDRSTEKSARNTIVLWGVLFVVVVVAVQIGLRMGSGTITVDPGGSVDVPASSPPADEAEQAGDEQAPVRRATLPSGQVIEGDFRILTFDEVMAEGGVASAMEVAIEKYPDRLRALLADGTFDANMRLPYGDDSWWTPIEKAMRQGTEETFDILIQAGADPNLLNSYGQNALHTAAWYGLNGAMEIFLAAGGDPNVVDQHNNAPLTSAAWEGHLDVIETLLAGGANPECHAVYSAARQGRNDVVERLVRAGASPSGSPNQPGYAGGFCPIYWAAYGGHEETVRLLLDLGARPVCPGVNEIPADAARERGFLSIANMLEGRR